MPVDASKRSTIGRGWRAVRRSRLGAAPAAALFVGLVVGTASAVGAPPRGGGSASAHPPVITEAFTPLLACNPDTTVGMEGCGEHRVVAADRRLNADVKVIFDLTSGTGRHDFVVAQTKWLAYRNADCRSQSDVYSGGTEQPVVELYCLAADDSARRQDLTGFFRTLTQGRAKVPKFP